MRFDAQILGLGVLSVKIQLLGIAILLISIALYLEGSIAGRNLGFTALCVGAVVTLIGFFYNKKSGEKNNNQNNNQNDEKNK